MMLDLAEHLKLISSPPDCGGRWEVEVALAIADGAPIGGDFIVFDAPPNMRRLQAVVVDASGKGADAATRSLMLAGAIAGLLGEVPSEVLLPAVNRHILRLGWEEHFATAAHLDVDLETGEFRIGVAGHPAVARLHAGSGKWELLRATGPALGLLSDVAWPQHRGRLAPGDILVVVTDGVIETPGEDLDVGLDRLLGQAEYLVLSGFAEGAARLLDTRRDAGRDDAQVLVVAHQRVTHDGPSTATRGQRPRPAGAQVAYPTEVGLADRVPQQR